MFRVWLRRYAATPKPPTAFQQQSLGRFASQQATKCKADRLDRVRQKFDWWIAKSPQVFRPTLRVIRDAPASYTISFLILHELTAIVPLAGLTVGFHCFGWLPAYFAEGEWAVESVEKLGRYARRKGWIQESIEQEAGDEVKQGTARLVENSNGSTVSGPRHEAVRWLIEVATAYTIVKALIPLRLLVSAWAAPAFARWAFIPLGNVVRRSQQTKSRK